MHALGHPPVAAERAVPGGQNLSFHSMGLDIGRMFKLTLSKARGHQDTDDLSSFASRRV